MQDGDHIDPTTGRRLIRAIPSWFGSAQRATIIPVVAPAPLATDDDPLPCRWAWTEDGYKQVAI